MVLAEHIHVPQKKKTLNLASHCHPEDTFEFPISVLQASMNQTKSVVHCRFVIANDVYVMIIDS